MSTALSKTDAATAFQGLVRLGRDYGGQVAEATLTNDIVARTMAVSFGMAALMDHIAENAACVNVICRGAGRKWGFKTDRDNKETGGTQYPVNVIIECACEAMLKGLMLVDNEWNIITGQQYTTQEGWLGLLQRKPGVSQIEVKIGTVQNIACREVKTGSGKFMQKITALISARASCLLHGVLIEVAATEMPDIDGRLQLKAFVADVDESIDQLKGKALCRIYERLYCKCFGVTEGTLATPEADESVTEPSEITEATVKTQEPPKEISEYEMHVKSWHATWSAEAKKVNDPNHPVLVCARQMRDATSETQLKLAADEADRLRKSELVSQRQFESLERYFEFLISKPQEVPA